MATDAFKAVKSTEIKDADSPRHIEINAKKGVFFVKQVKIEEIKADVVICSSTPSSKPTLDKGPARYILDAAGGMEIFEEAFRINNSKAVPYGSFTFTVPGELAKHSVKIVALVVYPRENSVFAMNMIIESLSKTLHEADARGMKSVALPGLGFDIKGINKKTMYGWLEHAILEFLDEAKSITKITLGIPKKVFEKLFPLS